MRSGIVLYAYKHPSSSPSSLDPYIINTNYFLKKKIPHVIKLITSFKKELHVCMQNYEHLRKKNVHMYFKTIMDPGSGGRIKKEVV